MSPPQISKVINIFSKKNIQASELCVEYFISQKNYKLIQFERFKGKERSIMIIHYTENYAIDTTSNISKNDASYYKKNKCANYG